jgi:CHAD domain-containing protein
MRALLRAGRPLLATDTDELQRRLKELGVALGAVRDLDVLLAELRAEAAELGEADREEARALLVAFARERSNARRRLLTLLRSPDYHALVEDTARGLDQLDPSGDEASLAELAAAAAKKLSKTAKKLSKAPSDDELHTLRKACKRARYAAELSENDRFVRRAKRLQDVLGEHQDAVVAEERLRAHAAAAPPAQAVVAGRLIERQAARRALAREAWPKAWRNLRQEA